MQAIASLRVSSHSKTARRAAVLLSAAAAAVSFKPASAATTDTWIGAIQASTGAYYWDTSTANWNNGKTGLYIPGDNAVFTDNFTGGTDLAAPSGGLNPATVTFSHISGSTPTTYNFHTSGDVIGSNPALPTLSNPFGPGTVLTLDSGYQGTVVVRVPQLSASSTNGNTIIRSGTLELQENQGLPGGLTRQTPTVTLDGGTLAINILLRGNFQPGSSDLSGPLTVLSNSTLALTQIPSNITSSRTWQGLVNVASNATLTLTSANGVRFRLPGNLSNSTGTFKLVDGVGNPTVVTLENAVAGAPNATFDLGTGSSALENNYTSNKTIDIGALTGGAGSTLRGGQGNATTSTYSIGAKGVDTTFAGTIASGTFAGALTAITKTGSSSLTLTGASTYTGATNVNGGNLVISGASGSISGSTAVNVNAGGTLVVDNTVNNNDRLGDTAAVNLNGGTLSFVGNQSAGTAEIAGPLTVATASSLVQTSATGTGSPASLTFASLARTGGVVDFRPAANSNIAFATAPTLTGGIIGGYATVNGNDWATVSGANVAAFSGYATDTAPGSWAAGDNVNITAAGSAAVAANTTINSLRFAGSSANGVSIAAGQSLNLATGGILATGTAGPTIAGPGSLTAGSAAGAEVLVNVADAGNTLTISAPITDNGAGAVSLTKAGPGKLVLASSGNSYTGSTSLLGGTLALGAANFFPAASALTINYGTTLDLNGFSQAVGAVSLIDGSIVSTGSPATLTGASYDVRNGTISAALGGTAALTKSTTGTVLLSGASSYTGITTVSNGTLEVTSMANGGSSSSVGASPGDAANLVISGGGTLKYVGAGASSDRLFTYTSSSSSAASLDASGTGPLVLTNTGAIVGTSPLTLTGTNTGNNTLSATLSGGASIIKNGAGRWVLAGANTNTGATTINAGTLAMGVDNALNATGNVALNGGTLDLNGHSLTVNNLNGPGAVLLSGNLAMTNGTSNPMVIGSISGSGTLTKSGTGNLNLSGPDIGGLTVNANNVNLLVNSGTARIGALTVSAGRLDVTNNRLVLTNTPAASVVSDLSAGYNSGAWNGTTGIVSSLAAGDPSKTSSIGYATAAQLGVSSWGTVSGVNPTDILLRYTFVGDLNLDGKVNADDYALIDRQVAKNGLGSSGAWINGDLNYDGVVNASDYLLLDTSFYRNNGSSMSPDFLAMRESEFGSAYVAALTAAVPEPASLGLVALAGLGLVRRRRHA